MTKQPLMKQLRILTLFLFSCKILKVKKSLILALSYAIKHVVNRCTVYLHWKRITFISNRLQPRNIYWMQIMQKLLIKIYSFILITLILRLILSYPFPIKMLWVMQMNSFGKIITMSFSFKLNCQQSMVWQQLNQTKNKLIKMLLSWTKKEIS